MSLKKAMTNEKGFTIVELLIVVIVIAILATITIVSFNNITNRANQSAADSAVATFVKKAELYSADGTTGTYPATFTVMNDPTKSFHMTTGVQGAFVTTSAAADTAAAALTAEQGKNNVVVRACGSPVTGMAIYAYKFAGSGPGTVGSAGLVRTLGTGC